MITSSDNERLKRVRKLRDRRWREREGLFATEGEDMLAAGLDAGRSPVDVLVAPGSDIAGVEVEPELLAAASTLGSSTRVIAVWEIPEPGTGGAPPPVYLDGVGDPGNVGTIVRTAAALTGARVVLGPGCADPYSPKAARASMGAVLATPPVRAGVAETPAPRLGLVAHGGAELDAAITGLGTGPTLCLGSERRGLPGEVIAACDVTATIPLRGPAESLNVAAAAAIALQRISSLAAAGVRD
ncbi:MAG TPA: RNA methyltransferase [Solirubrobacterales bacterium]|nr:RNA methyltransferase [Solirubrobacterales bacterium]